MPRDAHTRAHKDTHTHQHLEGSLVIKNTPTHSTHSTHSLRTPNRYTYIHTHRRITQARKDTQGQVPDSDKEHPNTHGHTTHLQAQLQRSQLQETGSMRARQGPEKGTTSHPEQICPIGFTWGAQWRIWGTGAVLTVLASCLFALAPPTTSPHLAGPPRAGVWTGGRPGQTGPGRGHPGRGLGAEEQARREGEVADTRATPSAETDGGRARDSEPERR